MLVYAAAFRCHAIWIIVILRYATPLRLRFRIFIIVVSLIFSDIFLLFRCDDAAMV